MAIQRRVIVYQCQTPIAAAAVQAWNSTPIEVAPAPGANRLLRPCDWTAQYKAGSSPFGVTDVDNEFFNYGVYVDTTHASGSALLFSAGASLLLSQTADHIEHGLGASLSISSTALPAGFTNVNIINKPLLLKGNNDLLGGRIATKTLNAAGLLYAALDTGHIIQGSNTSATYRVDTIGGGGAVATFTITDPGANYVAANGLSTDTSGAGSGLKVNITGITKGNGSLVTTVAYYIVQLS